MKSIYKIAPVIMPFLHGFRVKKTMIRLSMILNFYWVTGSIPYGIDTIVRYERGSRN